MARRAAPKVVDEWDRGRSAAWTAASAMVAGAVAAFGDARVLALSPLWPLLAGVVCAAASVYVGVQNAALRAGIFRASCWAAAACWVAYCYRYGAWKPVTWEALGAGTVALGVLSLAFPMPDEHTADDKRPAPPSAAQSAEPDVRIGPDGVPTVVDPEARKWEQRLHRVCGIEGCEVTEIADWPSGTGYDVRGVTPDDGTSWKSIDPQRLRASLRVARGCGVEVAQGEHSGEFVIGVSTVDALSDEALGEDQRSYLDTSMLTIDGPIPLGVYRDGTQVEANLRQCCSFTVGQRGSGKSNFLHNLSAGFLRCPDVLVWHIDLGGAGLALPWVGPWLDGDMERPVVDWVATDPAEAILMTEFALQVIDRRRAAYRLRMKERNSDILPCSFDLPAIRIILDETAEAAGQAADPRLKANITRIIQLGRSTAVGFDLSGLRGTSAVCPTEAMAQISMRVLFGVASVEEIGYALGWHTKLNPADAPYPGVGWFRPSLADPVRVFRGPRTALPHTIESIAHAVADRRPALDAKSLNVPLREQYLSRWDRVVPLLAARDGDRGEPPVSTAVSIPLGTVSTAGRHAAPTGGEHLVSTGEHPGGHAGEQAAREQAAGSVSTLQASVDAFKRSLEAAQRAYAAPRVDPADEVPAPRAELTLLKPHDAARARMMELLHEAGAEGMSGPAVAKALADEGYPGTQATVYRWLAELAVDKGYGCFRHPDFGSAA